MQPDRASHHTASSKFRCGMYEEARRTQSDVVASEQKHGIVPGRRGSDGVRQAQGPPLRAQEKLDAGMKRPDPMPDDDDPSCRSRRECADADAGSGGPAPPLGEGVSGVKGVVGVRPRTCSSRDSRQSQSLCVVAWVTAHRQALTSEPSRPISRIHPKTPFCAVAPGVGSFLSRQPRALA